MESMSEKQTWMVLLYQPTGSKEGNTFLSVKGEEQARLVFDLA